MKKSTTWLRSTTQVYKARSTHQTTIKGPFTKMKHLLKLIHDVKFMCWTKNIKESDVITHAF